jgi:Domain of unknown function (DUF4395)
MGESKMHFVQQQGFEEAGAPGCAAHYAALMFQPRVTGVIVAFALVTQSAPLFLALSALLWWNVLVPTHNPFDALYNRMIAEPRQLTRLEPAPPPRRFAQGMAGSFMLGIGVCLLAGWLVAAWILQVFLFVALSALIFGRFCLGSYIYYLLHGRTGFANRTLPWAHG